MHTTHIDGVPVFWAPAPGPLTAGLLFGCGTRDESFMTIGVTHLAEHLVMSTLPKLHHDHNATVDLTTTSFYATGRPEQVVAFLRGVCEGISRPPLERLRNESGVLEAESGFAVHPTAAALLTRRYGIRDVGLEFFTGPGPATISADALLAHLRRYFVAGNAALWLSGPPPEDLRLPLPEGPRVVRVEPTPLPQAGPAWESAHVPATGILLRGENDVALTTAGSILIERLTDEARHQRGVSYDVFADKLLIGPRTREHLVGADARPGEAATVARILWAQATALATEGPTEAELEHQRTGVAEMFSDERWPAEEASAAAEASLLGIEFLPAEVRLTQMQAVTREDVRQAMAQVLPTALIAVPDGVQLALPGVAEGGCQRRRAKPVGRAYTMKLVARLFTWQWRPPRYYVTRDGLARLDPDGDLHETPFAEVVGVGAEEGERMVFAANACLFPIPTLAYRRGEELAYAIDTAVPATIRFGSEGKPPPPPATGAAPGWTVWRVLNAVGAVLFALSTVVLFLAWMYLDFSPWWWITGAVVTLWCAWDARPRGRMSVPTQPSAPMQPAPPGGGGPDSI